MSLGVLFIVTLWLFLSPNTVIALLWFNPHENDLVKAATGTCFFLLLFITYFVLLISIFLGRHLQQSDIITIEFIVAATRKKTKKKKRKKKKKKKKGRQHLGIIVLRGYADRVTDVSYRYATYYHDFPYTLQIKQKTLSNSNKFITASIFHQTCCVQSWVPAFCLRDSVFWTGVKENKN